MQLCQHPQRIDKQLELVDVEIMLVNGAPEVFGKEALTLVQWIFIVEKAKFAKDLEIVILGVH